MREIKKTRMIEEVVGYEAYDGTRFMSEEECRKYEDLTAKDAIIKKFSDLIVAMAEEDEDITKANYKDKSFVGFGIGEGNGIALVRIKDENDLYICNAYSEIISGRNRFTEDMIGKEILVFVACDYYGENKITGNWNFDDCYVYGTVEDQIALYTKRLREAFEVSKEV